MKLLIPTQRIFLCIPTSSADAAAVNPNVIKMLIANGCEKSEMISFASLVCNKKDNHAQT